MTALDTAKAALLARRGLDYITEFDAFFDQLVDDVDAIGARLVATSTTSASIGTGAKSLTVQTEKLFAAGQYVVAYETATPANFMIGLVTSYTTATGALAFTVASGDTGGSGTIAAWTVAISSKRGATGATGGIAGGTLTGSIVADGNDITGIGTVSATTGTVTDLTVSDTATFQGLTTVEAAGEHAEENAANATGTITIQATDPTVLRRTLTGDVTLLVAGAPTPGKGWSTELRTTQDGTGGRDLTILPANMLVNTATLSTQSVTVTAAAHTLSFYGTGSVTLSGVSTAGPLVGTGAGARVTLTFTPTSGSLTLTVAGTVSTAQLVLGSASLGYIAVGGTRAASVVWRAGSANAIDYAAQAAAAESRIIIGVGSDGEILIDDVSLEA